MFSDENVKSSLRAFWTSFEVASDIYTSVFEALLEMSPRKIVLLMLVNWTRGEGKSVFVTDSQLW